MRAAAPGHLDPLDQPETLGKPFAASVLFHAVVVAALLVGAAVENQRNKPFMGAVEVGAGVPVTAVQAIPLPQKSGRISHVANDTENVVPQEKPLKLAEQRPVRPPEPKKAIELPEKVLPKTVPKPTSPVQYREKREYSRSQIFTQTPEALKSDQIGQRGNGGVGISQNSVFGYQFGAYAQQIRDLISAKWNQAGINAPPSAVAIVSIRIGRDGSVSVVNVQTSGNYLLDTSARRAVLDASPLPPLPPGFPRTEADADLLFQLRR